MKAQFFINLKYYLKNHFFLLRIRDYLWDCIHLELHLRLVFFFFFKFWAFIKWIHTLISAELYAYSSCSALQVTINY